VNSGLSKLRSGEEWHVFSHEVSNLTEPWEEKVGA